MTAPLFYDDHDECVHAVAQARAGRDAALAEVARLNAQIDDMETSCTDHQISLKAERDAAYATIAEIREYVGQENTDSWHATKRRRVREFLAQSPADALAEHDRQAKADALEEAARALAVDRLEGSIFTRVYTVGRFSLAHADRSSKLAEAWLRSRAAWYRRGGK